MENNDHFFQILKPARFFFYQNKYKKQSKFAARFFHQQIDYRKK